jgi:hypothetical protein
VSGTANILYTMDGNNNSNNIWQVLDALSSINSISA